MATSMHNGNLAHDGAAAASLSRVTKSWSDGLAASHAPPEVAARRLKSYGVTVTRIAAATRARAPPIRYLPRLVHVVSSEGWCIACIVYSAV